MRTLMSKRFLFQICERLWKMEIWKQIEKKVLITNCLTVLQHFGDCVRRCNGEKIDNMILQEKN